MKILITGASGFVGSHLTDLLSGNHDLYSLVRSPEKAKSFDVKGTLIKGDLSKESIQSWIEELPSDLEAVVHTAGIVHHFDTRVFKEVNTDATEWLTNALKERYPKLKFILISSLAAFGPTPKDAEELQEDLTQNPVSDYGRSKKDAEEILKKLETSEWTKVIINPPMVIGPRDVAILDVFKMFQDGLVLVSGMNGYEKEYSFVNVFDLCHLIEKTLTLNEDQQFFSSYPKSITMKELLDEIGFQMNKNPFRLKVPHFIIQALANVLAFLYKVSKVSLRLTPDKVNELIPKRWICSGKRSEEVLKFQYQYDLKSTIESTLKDYRSRGWLK